MYSDSDKKQLVIDAMQSGHALASHIDDYVMHEFTEIFKGAQFTDYRLFGWMAENYPDELESALALFEITRTVRPVRPH